MDYRLLSTIIPKKTAQWSTADVSKWLQFVNLTNYITNFENASIDGRSLKLLDQEDLVIQLGVKSKIVCKKFMNWILNGLQQFDQFLQQIDSGVLFQLEPMEKTQNNDYFSHFPPCNMNSLKSTKKKTPQDLLIIKKVQQAQKFYYKICERDCRIGSNPNCEIQVSSQNIEPFHVHISYRNGLYYLRDGPGLGSVFIKVDNRIPLLDGMQIEMGSNLFQICINEAYRIQVKIKQGKNKDTTFKFSNSKNKILIGRKSSNDISFPHDITLSNLHAKLTFSDFIWYLEDLATTNGTWFQLKGQSKIFSGMIFKLGLTNTQFECQLRKIKQNQDNEQSQQQTYVYVQLQNQYCRKCNKNMRNILYQPCNHCVVCQECDTKLKICQICGKKIISATKIYKT